MSHVPDDHSEVLAFVATARKLSFRRAAACLHVSPSVVTRRVAAFEQRHGVALLARSSHSVALTETGERLLPAAEAWLREREESRLRFLGIVTAARTGTSFVPVDV